jgi:hypothetical protein
MDNHRYLPKGEAMHISLQKISAIVIILGSVLFLIAAFSPISHRVFPEPSAARKLEVITATPTAWLVAQIFFALGALVTVIGIALVGYRFRDQSFALLLQASVAVLVLGALLWIWYLFMRTVDPAAFAEGSLPLWALILYFVLTEAGLAVFGAALLRSALRAWVGWLVIGGMVLFFVLTLIMRDMVPLFYYVITLLTGVMLYGHNRKV